MLFNNKYRIESSRLKTWDYSANAPYFITICTENKLQYFGNIIDQENHLSQLGIAASDCWMVIPQHFPFVELGAFVIMPNHVHGILIINKTNINPKPSSCKIDPDTVETQNLASLRNMDHNNTDTQQNKFGPQSRNLASIIRGFKIGVTKYAINNHLEFKWQSRFHDHVIRDEKSHINIHNYIINNPLNWEKDKFFIEKKGC